MNPRNNAWDTFQDNIRIFGGGGRGTILVPSFCLLHIPTAPSLHFCLIRGNLLGLLRSGCPTKNVKRDIKPAVDVGVDSMVLVTDLLGG